MEFELTAEVSEYVEPFEEVAQVVEDAFVVPEPPLEFPWLDGVTEVPEGFLWPEQVAEALAQAEFDAWQFTPEFYAEAMAALGIHGATIEIPEFSLV